MRRVAGGALLLGDTPLARAGVLAVDAAAATVLHEDGLPGGGVASSMCNDYGCTDHRYTYYGSTYYGHTSYGFPDFGYTYCLRLTP